MADEVDVAPSMPRVCRRQTQRANPPVQEAEAFYRTTISVPMLDHINAQMMTRFSKLHQAAAGGLVLIPAFYFTRPLPDARSLVYKTATNFKADLPSHYVDDTSVEAELDSWEATMVRKQNIKTAQETLKATTKTMWPILHELLVVVCTMQITTVECERLISGLRRLKTYLRSTMGQVRLSSLALIHSHYSIDIDNDAVISMFMRMFPRKIICRDVLEDEESDSDSD